MLLIADLEVIPMINTYNTLTFFTVLVLLMPNLVSEWFNNTLKNNTIRCKKLATIVLG